MLITSEYSQWDRWDQCTAEEEQFVYNKLDIYSKLISYLRKVGKGTPKRLEKSYLKHFFLMC